MKKSTQLLITAIVAFIVSGIFTIIWFTSSATTQLGFMLALGMAVVYETFKINSGIMSLTCKWLHITIRITLGVISICTVAYSILASTGYLINESNTIINDQITNSTSYKQSVDNREMKKDLYSTTKNEKERLQKEKEIAIANLKSQIISKQPNSTYKNWNEKAAASNNFYKSQEQIKKDIVKINNEYEQKIESASQRINDLANQVTKDDDKITVYTRHYKGSYAISTFIAQKFDGTADDIELLLKVIASIIFEIIAWISAVLYPIVKKNEGSSTPPKTKIKIPTLEKENEKMPRIIQSGRLKGMRFKSPQLFANRTIDELSIKKYWAKMKELTKNNKAPSHSKLIKELDLTKEQCDMARKELKNRNKISVKKNHTKVV